MAKGSAAEPPAHPITLRAHSMPHTQTRTPGGGAARRGHLRIPPPLAGGARLEPARFPGMLLQRTRRCCGCTRTFGATFPAGGRAGEEGTASRGAAAGVGGRLAAAAGWEVGGGRSAEGEGGEEADEGRAGRVNSRAALQRWIALPEREAGGARRGGGSRERGEGGRGSGVGRGGNLGCPGPRRCPPRRPSLPTRGAGVGRRRYLVRGSRRGCRSAGARRASAASWGLPSGWVGARHADPQPPAAPLSGRFLPPAGAAAAAASAAVSPSLYPVG